MTKTSIHRCPGCGGPTATCASVRIEYRELHGDTFVDEVDVDALRCANAACRYTCTDLAEATQPGVLPDPQTPTKRIFDRFRAPRWTGQPNPTTP